MIYVFDDFRLSPTGFTLTKNESERNIEPQVLDLIVLLVKNHGQLITKDDIIEKIWDGQIRSESSISTLVSQARAALDDSGRSQKFIKTVHNKGYKFIGDVTVTVPGETDRQDPIETDLLETPKPEKQLPIKAIMFVSGLVLVSFGLIKMSTGFVPDETREATTILDNSIPENVNEYARTGISRNPNIVPKGKAVTFAISDHSVGDIIDGGDGFDTLDLSTYTDGGVFVGLPGQVARDRKYKKGEGEYNILNIENVIGTPQDDLIRGSIFPNVIRGGDGDDQLFSYGDQDVIYGGPGDDYLNGGYELDIIYGGPGNDRILVATISRGDHMDGGDDEDTFDLSKFTASPYYVDLSKEFSRELSDREKDIYKIVNVENVVGTPMNDTIIGDLKDNVLKGGGGSDVLNGGDGDDIAVYQGEYVNYVFSINEDNSLKITDKFGYDGIDSVTNIETFRFSDKSLTIAEIKENMKP
ncbi:MAG: winged helix-turn-helix domain-containing protein [Hellea sp.]